MRTIVVLPAPFGPRRAKMLPWATVRSTPSSTRWSPKDLCTPTAVIAGAVDESDMGSSRSGCDKSSIGIALTYPGSSPEARRASRCCSQSCCHVRVRSTRKSAKAAISSRSALCPGDASPTI